MIYIKENTMDRISNWSDDSICVLTDFDRTITTGNSPSSWSILSNSNMISNEYVKESYELYNAELPGEMLDWSFWYDNAETVEEYHSEQVVGQYVMLGIAAVFILLPVIGIVFLVRKRKELDRYIEEYNNEPDNF